MMDFSKLVELRQSCRKYDALRDVEPEKLEQCLSTARLSPSSTNSQPWHFIVINNKELRAEVDPLVAGFARMNSFAKDAPIIVALVMEKPNLLSNVGSVIQDKEYSLLDLGIVALQFCLQAIDLGLGTCMVGWFKEKALKKVLDVPHKLRIPLVITLGYPLDTHRKKTRKSIDKIVSYNRY